MLEVDKRRDDQELNQNPVRDRDRPPKRQPDDEKQNCREQFDNEVARGNWCAAVRAFAAELQPGDERQIVPPRNLVFAVRAKRAPRLIDREAEREQVAEADAEAEEDAEADADADADAAVGVAEAAPDAGPSPAWLTAVTVKE